MQYTGKLSREKNGQNSIKMVLQKKTTMKITFSFIIVLLASLTTSAQTYNIDSLVKVLKENRKEYQPIHRIVTQSEANALVEYVIKIDMYGVAIVYKSAAYPWGGPFYFKNGNPIAKNTFITETKPDEE